MKRLNNLYEQLTPLTTAEELSQKIMNPEMKITAKKRPSRAVTAILAAALSVSALTLTAGAANNWDYAGIFRNLFGESSENISGNILPEATVLKDTISNMDFEIVAAAADKHSTLVILDVYSENGYKLIEDTENGHIVRPVHNLLLDLRLESGASGAYSTSTRVIEESEEKVRLGIKMNTENQLKYEKLTINAIPQNTSEGECTIDKNDSVWSAKFTVNYSNEEIRYEKDEMLSGTAYDGSEVSMKLTSIEISPISLFLGGETLDNFFGAFWRAEESYVVLENGEKVRITDIMSSSYTEGDPKGSTLLALGLETPITPEQAQAIEIGDITIEIK